MPKCQKTTFNVAAGAMLNCRKLPFWSCVKSHVIIHLRSKIRINWPIWRRDIAKKDFNMASVRHLELAKFRLFVKE